MTALPRARRTGVRRVAVIAAVSIIPAVAILPVLACGEADRPPRPAKPRVEQVERSGLERLALTARGVTVEAPLVMACSVAGAGAGRSGVVAPPCRTVRGPDRLPTLRVDAGEVVEITTGDGAANVSLVRKRGRGRREAAVDAEPVDEERGSWRARMPAGAGERLQVSVSPLRTDSGSLGFAIDVR